MVRVFLPYSYTSTKISSLTGNQKCLIFSVFAHEIRSRDPQRRVPCRMSGNFYDREGNAVDPYSPFEEILILSPRKCFDNETMVDTQILFAQHSETVVRRGDRAIEMLLSDRSRDFALHQPVQNQVTYYARTLLLDYHESFVVWSNIIHSNSFILLELCPARPSERRFVLQNSLAIWRCGPRCVSTNHRRSGLRCPWLAKAARGLVLQLVRGF